MPLQRWDLSGGIVWGTVKRRNVPEDENIAREKTTRERHNQLEATASLRVHIRGYKRVQATGGMTPATPMADDRKSVACPTPVQFGDFQVEGGGG